MPQPVEGNGRKLQALQKRPVRAVDPIGRSLTEKPGEGQRLPAQTVRHNRRKRNAPDRCTRLDRGKRKPIKTLHLNGQDAISREVTATSAEGFAPALTATAKKKHRGNIGISGGNHITPQFRQGQNSCLLWLVHNLWAGICIKYTISKV